MILNLYLSEMLEKPEWTHRSLCELTHEKLKVSVNIVYQVVSEAMKKNTLTENKNPDQRHPSTLDKMSEDCKSRLRKRVHQLIQALQHDKDAEKKYLTLEMVHDDIKDDPSFPPMSRSTLLKVIRRIGFK